MSAKKKTKASDVFGVIGICIAIACSIYVFLLVGHKALTFVDWAMTLESRMGNLEDEAQNLADRTITLRDGINELDRTKQDAKLPKEEAVQSYHNASGENVCYRSDGRFVSQVPCN